MFLYFLEPVCVFVNSIDWLLTILVSSLAIVFYLLKRTKIRLVIMIAMLLSTCADMFTTGTIPAPGSLFIGAGLFMVSHLVYSYAVLLQLKKNNLKVTGKGFWIGVIIMIVTAIALEVLAFTVPDSPNTLMAFLLLIYVAIIGINTVLHFSLGCQMKGKYIWLPIAMCIFYMTDLWIFIELLDIYHGVMPYIWIFYPVAQALLVTFNDPIWEK